MNIFKKILSKNTVLALASTVALSVLLVQTSFLVAQVIDEEPNYGATIREVVLEKNEYNYGETIKGSFVIQNDSDVSISNAKYIVYLVGDIEEGISGTYYENEVSEPYYLGLDETKSIDFEYTLPKYKLGENVGIEIHGILESGIVLSWAVEGFNIADQGYVKTMNITGASLVKGDKVYNVHEGPTVYEDEVLSLVAYLENNNDSEINAYPSVTIFDRDEGNKIIKEEDLDVVQLAPDSQYTFNLELDRSFEPGVYPGKVDFLNEEGERLSQTVHFRYIINGISATIYSVSVDKMSVESGDDFFATVLHAGTPFDIDLAIPEYQGDVSDYDFSSQIFDIEIIVSDSKGNIISQDTVSNDFSRQNSTEIPLVAEKSSNQLFVNAYVKKDGEVIAEYITELPIDEMQDEVEERGNILKYLGIVVLILIIIFIIIFIKRRKGGNGQDITTTIAVLLVALVTAAGSAVYAWTGDGSSDTSNGIIGPITLTVDSIRTDNNGDGVINSDDGDPQYEIGDQIRVKGSASAWSCNNIGRDMKIYYKIDDFQGWKLIARQKYEEHEFSGSPTTNYNTLVDIPGAPGEYTIRVKAVLEVARWWSGEDVRDSNYSKKKDTFIIINPDPEDGVCASPAHNTYQASAPSGSELCSSGDPSSVNSESNGTFTWTCNPLYGATATSSCATTPPQCGDDIDNDGDGLTDSDGNGDPSKIDSGCDNSIDPNENNVGDLSCSVVSPSGGNPYDLNTDITIQAFISGFNDYENIQEYNWSGSFTSGLLDTKSSQAITNSFSSAGTYDASLSVKYDGVNSSTVQCTASGDTNIEVADAPDVTFDIPNKISDSDGYCSAQWTLSGTYNPTLVSCSIVNEFGDIEFGDIEESQASGNTNVRGGNEYKLVCDVYSDVIGGTLVTTIETSYERCNLNPDLIER